MSDIIHLLPDSIANQIAAGEVVQRPASVVKELVENAIDAGATNIQLRFIDAGKTLIQVIDNGKGMSTTDARMAFERHATSKIKKAEDLFALCTMGFRGEALPSIAAVAQVELISKPMDASVGTILQIEGSKVKSQEIIAAPQGSNIAVKNLFFNIPARRKFLKSNETERKNILSEWERIVLVYPNIEFTLLENDIELCKYPASSLKQRIANVMGKTIGQQLLTIDVDTTLVKISGFVGKPDSARKTRAQQFFFVNGRYMRNPYFNSAVMAAYNQLIAVDEKPNYFIYITVDPQTIDVNIHPTKTEVKFENEQPIWRILSATTKEALGKFNEIPSIDFDQADAMEIPIMDSNSIITKPTVAINKSYNPFSNSSNTGKRKTDFDWENLYESFKGDNTSKNINQEKIDDLASASMTVERPIGNDLFKNHEYDINLCFQFKNKYIALPTTNGILIVDQRRAHIKIQYELFLKQITHKKGISQKVLFPEILELSSSEASFMPFVMDEIEALGFELANLGDNTYAINAVPSEIKSANAVMLLHELFSLQNSHTNPNAKDSIRQAIALSIARSAAVSSNQKLSQEEQSSILNSLFSLPQNKYTPDGKLIMYCIHEDWIDKTFK